ncbi:MAG: DUF935 domain-containing protein [Ignavibacteriaceae bacterium]|nr:DUF935 domain-containing protein [Ignavibacteriaceae bacterium]
MKNGKGKYLISEQATRDKLEAFSSFYKSLPDPDKILEENNFDYDIYRDLLTDPHLMATIQQRKMQVQQMGWELEFDADEKIKQRLIDIIRQLPLTDIISDTLDAIFFGFAVGEVMWVKDGKEIVPVNIIGKPQEWFIFSKKNELRMRTFKNGQYFLRKDRNYRIINSF